MSTADRIATPLLTPGQPMSQAEFHERYKATHPDFRAELIGGIVHIRGRVTARHGSVNHLAIYWVVIYDWRTPGVQGGCNGSTILDSSAEVHPDAKLRLLERFSFGWSGRGKWGLARARDERCLSLFSGLIPAIRSKENRSS